MLSLGSLDLSALAPAAVSSVAREGWTKVQLAA